MSPLRPPPSTRRPSHRPLQPAKTASVAPGTTPSRPAPSRSCSPAARPRRSCPRWPRSRSTRRRRFRPIARYVDRAGVDLPRLALAVRPDRLLEASSESGRSARSRVRCRAGECELGRGLARSCSATRPLTASLTVPSPPTATTRRAPSAAACSASSAMWPGRVREQRLADEARAAARCAISRPVPARPAVVRGRVDEEGDVPVRVGSISASLRSPPVGRARPSPRPPGAAFRRRSARARPPSMDVGDDEQAAGLTPRSAAIVNSAAASISTARIPRSAQRRSRSGVRVVEDVARRDRSDVQLPSQLLGRVHGSVEQLPVGGRALRLPVEVAGASCRRPVPPTARGRGRRGRVGARGPRRFRRGRSASRRAERAPRRRSRCDGQSPSRFACTETGLPSYVPVYPRRPRSPFTCARVVEEALGDPACAQGVAGKKAGLRVVARAPRAGGSACRARYPGSGPAGPYDVPRCAACSIAPRSPR